ncbi:hypothetical protein BKI52_25085 [marine bacterium AO1-C]|nr:hypothetical protein BKI52_25085 [marine bacterium AO1-C]
MGNDKKIPSIVFGSLEPGTIDIHVAPFGLNDGGSLIRVDTNKVPKDCRIPNTKVWVTMVDYNIVTVEKITENN